jgi:peptide deformylase
MLLDIVLHPDERLRQMCAPVTAMNDRLDDLFTHMFETMYAVGSNKIIGSVS